MTADQMWAQAQLQGPYEAWAFSEAADALAQLVLRGTKTATSSAYEPYGVEGERLPAVGDHSVILDGRGEAVAIVVDTAVAIVPFREVTADHAWLEGEDDRTLEVWRQVHESFFTRELAAIGRTFSKETLVVLEEFALVWPRSD